MEKDIKALLDKIRTGNYTPQEEEKVKYWLLKLNQDSPVPLSDEDLLQARDTMWAAIQQGKDPVLPFRRLWPRIVAAASILLALSAGSYLLLHKDKMAEQIADVQPGGNKAILTLGDGQRISLSNARTGAIASQAGIPIRKTAEGTILYDHAHGVHIASEMVYNRIETPRGGQYQIVLPDGSKVWLNAASSLRYPAAFTGAERNVELKGEAYFEVAKDKTHPFKVKTEGETVEVLGTHFDISSYADEPDERTTLLEGSVRIITANGQRIIKPGDQAVLSAEQLRVRDADQEEVLGWKNGLFVFNEESLESIMRKVARWYDVDIRYGNIDKHQTFGGGVSRFSTVSKVLEKLESTKLVHFKLEGRVIYVSK